MLRYDIALLVEKKSAMKEVPKNIWSVKNLVTCTKHFIANTVLCNIPVIKDFLLDRIEHEFLFYCSDLVANSCFLISNPQKYHI